MYDTKQAIYVKLEVTYPTQRFIDFANREYAELWFHQFSSLDLELAKSEYGYNGDTVVASLNNYLGIAFKYNFAIPGKECVAWWRDFIKRTKPQSPTRRAYYAHIPAPTKSSFYTERTKPLGQSYGGNGFGKVPMHTAPLGDKWLDKHYEKYPDGILPEQTMEIVRI